MSDKEFPKRYEKKLPTGFVESVESMDLEEIKKKIYESECHVYEIEKEESENEHLLAAKNAVKEIAAPFKEAKSVENAKIKYCFYVLEGRGVQLTPDT